MDQTRTQQPRYGAAGIPGAAPLVARADGPKGMAARMAGAAGRWLRGAVLAAGVVYVVTWVALVVGIPAIGRTVWRPPQVGSSIAKRGAADRLRPFAVTKDPSITPEAAGVAFASMSPAPKRSPTTGFTYRTLEHRPEAPWRDFDLSPLAFRSGVSRFYNGPNPKTIIAAAAKGLPGDERALLRRYGTAGVWTAFDRVARAPKVDFVAGTFELPFGAGADMLSLPNRQFAPVKDLAYASVARAAWHLAEGRRDSAEAALRAVVSVGLQLVDNGRGLIDELVGAIIVGIGADGLVQMFTVTHDPRLAQVQGAGNASDARRRAFTGVPWAGASSLEEAQAAMIAMATSGANATTAERMEALFEIPQLACSSTRDLIVGQSNEVRAAFDAARRDYAGLPGQLALLDLYESQLEQPLPGERASRNASVMRTARLISGAYVSPRLAKCALIVLGGL